MPSQSEFPSGEEMAVIFWLAVFGAIAVGIGAFILAAKAEAQETAVMLRVVGVLAVLFAAAVVIGRKIVSIFLD